MSGHVVLDLPAQVARKIAIDASGCWIWTAHVSRHTGYGHSWDPEVRKVKLAHRRVYEILVGPIPAGLEIDHLCRVRACCNPAHLEPVTHAVNDQRGYWGTKTECVNGHEYTPETTGLSGAGHRYCRICKRDYMRRRYRKTTAEARP